ncbi:MAG: hypothetical protein AAF745_10880, partial [Planctomycetota bacterium]
MPFARQILFLPSKTATIAKRKSSQCDQLSWFQLSWSLLVGLGVLASQWNATVRNSWAESPAGLEISTDSQRTEIDSDATQTPNSSGWTSFRGGG